MKDENLGDNLISCPLPLPLTEPEVRAQGTETIAKLWVPVTPEGQGAEQRRACGSLAVPPRPRTDHASRAFLVSGQAQHGFSGFFS